MKKCPACGSSKYKEGVCRNCKFKNNPNYLKRGKNDLSKQPTK